MEVGTYFSADRQYRYTLWREWLLGEGYAMFIGLNPSTADELNDDPTVRRCIGYAESWGFKGLMMTNIFAYRATDPVQMMRQFDPVGPANDAHLRLMAKNAGVVVAAWGAHGIHMSRGSQVRRMLEPLHYLKFTKSGQPQHPLYLPKILRPTLWSSDGK